MMNKALNNFGKTLSILAAIFAMSAATLSGAVTAKAPVSYEKALKDAEKVAALNDSWKVMRGAGDSMLPYYSDNSVLVVDEISYADLRVGMVAVYREAEGELVAHTVRARSAEGWVARGINNRSDDPNLVSERNFVGVVFGVLNAAEAPSYEIAGIGSLPVVYGKKF